ncbi:MAG: hypothetical protein QNK89_01955 [Lacinutrix sp.]|uniref:hypothetical protein n=1 Tax=Lacinutrix sp. TaxID=1937692 RepID=UPI0030A0B03D
MSKFIVAIAILFSILCSSCITNKDVVYLQDKGTVVNDSLLLTEMGKPYRVQINDILSVNIKSTNSEITELLEIFKPVKQEGISNSVHVLY